MLIERASHLGLCVANLERSRAFYCRGLGFREVSELRVEGEAVDTLLELEDTRLHAVYLERDGLRLELLHFGSPPSPAAGQPGAMNQPGLTHLSFRVASLEKARERLEALGGRWQAATLTQNEAFGASAAFVLDPDGTRIELVAQPGDPQKLPGER